MGFRCRSGSKYALAAALAIPLVALVVQSPADGAQGDISRFAGNYSDERDDFARDAFGLNESLPYDETGRIILSPSLKFTSGIDKLAFFIAAGDYFEIWQPQRLIEHKGATSPAGRIVQQLLDARK